MPDLDPSDVSLLRGALLWLRNHYEIGVNNPSVDKSIVLKVIDTALHGKVGFSLAVSHADLQRFRRWAKKHAGLTLPE